MPNGSPQTDTPRRSPWIALVWALAAMVAVAAPLIVGTWIQWGITAALRCTTELVLPVGAAWLFLAGAAGYCTARHSRRLACVFYLAFVLWMLVGNGRFSNWCMQQVEWPLTLNPHPALERRVLDSPLDAVVVLGGGSLTVLPGFYEGGEEGERVISAAQAWHAGAVRMIIVTGSSSTGRDHPREQSRQILESLRVPGERIFEIEGINTRAEMKALAAWLKSPPEQAFPWLNPESAPLPQAEPPGDGSARETDLLSGTVAREVDLESRSLRVGLITSAYHLPRALRLAKSEALDLIPLPCCFRANQNPRSLVASDFVPSASGLLRFSKAAKEVLARLAGQ
ncbi:MAG: YdcF family protein [Planctomycetota bacterium]